MTLLRIGLFALAGWLLTAGRPAPSSAAAFQQAAPQEGQAVEYEKRLSQIRTDIERLRGRLGREEKREKTVMSEINRIAVKKRLLRSEWDLLRVQLSKTRTERDAVSKSIPELQRALADDRERLARVLVTLYKHGRFNPTRIALEARDLRMFLEQARNLGLIADAQDRLITDFIARLDELGRADRELRRKEIEIATLTKQAAEKRAELDAEERNDKAQIARIKSNQKSYEQAISELNLRAQELENLLRELQSKPGEMIPGIPFAETRGRLAWPVNGRVTQNFGLQRGSFNTKTQNNGVEIAPTTGDLTVRAIHAGKVVYADFFPSYGNLLILDHGGSFHSLYGHCAEFLVKTGDIVPAGTPVALAGDTASLVGLSLYFEIRFQTKPVDPLAWLRRR